jgi:hypothetical protein
MPLRTAPSLPIAPIVPPEQPQFNYLPAASTLQRFYASTRPLAAWRPAAPARFTHGDLNENSITNS